MAKEKNREHTDTEGEFKQALESLMQRHGLKHDNIGIIEDPDLRQMSKCFSEHAVEIRNQGVSIGHLERRLHGADHRADFAASRIARAAEARAKIAAEAIDALRELVPQAKAQAKKGKPALLRMILRATR